jgi:protein-S-isoprenylcysteine O-methyltransferase Ste14
VRRGSAVVGSALFLLVAPGTVAGLVPWWISRWRWTSLAPGWLPVRLLGALLLLLGVALLLDAFRRFALEGIGTPAPILPTRHLVVSGPYRHVRNPMYVSVLAVILGQGLLLPSEGVLLYGALVFLAFHAFVLAYEEPTLRRKYGPEYEAFCRHVPRWIPRLRPSSGTT